jgi:hypothetical protein
MFWLLSIEARWLHTALNLPYKDTGRDAQNTCASEGLVDEPCTL